MTYRVDMILNAWFGEPPEHSEQEAALLKHLYGPLRALEDELKLLHDKGVEQSWRDNPDRSGGQFTQDEIDNAGQWR